jgi:plastocyanin
MMTKKKIISRTARTCALVLALGFGMAACGGGSGNQQAEPPTSDPGATRVKVALFRYQPGTIQVPAGGSVTWHNDDAIVHTVTAGVPGQPGRDFDKELADKGATASVRFDRPGTFKYFCARHPEAMRGEVTVRN